MEFVNTKNAPQAIGPYSQATIANGLVFTSGQIALSCDGVMSSEGVEEQTKIVLNNLKAVLEEANSSLQKVVKTTIFLKSMSDFAKVNEIYEEFFGTHKPSRSTVEVSELPKNALVEIDCIALI